MHKETPGASPNDLPAWVFDGQLTIHKAPIRLSLAKLVKYKGWNYKDLKLDMELVRNVVTFYGLESTKWRAINPLALRFTHKVVTALYDAMRYLLEKSDEL